LSEGFEDRGLFLDGDANAGVGDGDMEFDGVCRLRFCGDIGDDFTCVSELDGVAREVDDDLAEAAGISDQFVRHVRLDVPSEFQALLMRA